jgi:hypothetical protein
MRLIDADELKKCAIPCEIHNGALTDMCVPLYQIDNAPTVEPVTTLKLTDLTEEDKKNFILLWQRATSKGLLVEPERPQGEWIPCYVNFTDGSKPLFAYCKCSLCNKQATGVYKFCPNCGAEMVGGES